MEAEAEVLKLEAERRLGQLMQAQRETVGFNVGTRGSRTKGARVSEKPTLAEAGIDKNLAHKARSAAAMTAPEFEAAKETKRKSIIAKPKTEPKKKKATSQVATSLADRCIEMVRNNVERTIGEMRRGRTPQKKYELLFAALGDVIGDLERKTLPFVVDAAEYAERRTGRSPWSAPKSPRNHLFDLAFRNSRYFRCGIISQILRPGTRTLFAV